MKQVYTLKKLSPQYYAVLSSAQPSRKFGYVFADENVEDRWYAMAAGRGDFVMVDVFRTRRAAIEALLPK